MTTMTRRRNTRTVKNDHDNVDTKEKMINKTTKLVPILLRRYLVKPYIVKVKEKKLAESFQVEKKLP